jgi:hypothetical protein
LFIFATSINLKLKNMTTLDASSLHFQTSFVHFENALNGNNMLNCILKDLESDMKRCLHQTMKHGSQEFKEKILMKRN